jgi:hypothetical protein
MGTHKYKAGMVITKPRYSVSLCKMHPRFMRKGSAIPPNYKLGRYKNDFFSPIHNQGENLENIQELEMRR